MPWFADVAMLAVLIWGIVECFKMVVEHQKTRQRTQQSEVETAQAARIQALEERIKVLEAIVTDKSYELKQKISAL